jgi:hypothetical protein
MGAGAAGCGGSGTGSPVRSSRLDQGDRSFIAFTQCMRHRGAHMADPYHRAGHSSLTLDMPTMTPREQGGIRRLQASEHLGLVRYAQCMRAHGIPMLDPDANGNLDLGNVPGIASVGRYTPLFRRADHTCRSLLPAGVADNGTGP